MSQQKSRIIADSVIYSVFWICIAFIIFAMSNCEARSEEARLNHEYKLEALKYNKDD